MDALAVGAEIGGILGGLAIVVGLTIWVWVWREQTQKAIAKLNAQTAALHTQVEALQEQLAALDERQRSCHEKAIMLSLDVREEVRGVSKQVTELDKGWARLSIGRKSEGAG